MPDFIFHGSAPVDVYAPSGHPDALRVEPGQMVTVPGDLAAEQPTDAYLVGEGDDARLWPHTLWELKLPPAKTPASPPAMNPTDLSAPSEGTN